MTKISRQALLEELSYVQYGLSPKDEVEQSACFVFQNGRVVTFNEEVCCSMPSCLSITGAVRAGPLLSLLDRLKDSEVRMEVGKTQLLIAAKGRKNAGIKMEKEIELPLESYEPPTKWKKLDKKFCDALAMVHVCASEDEGSFNMTCVHLHPEFMEACNNMQLTRYTISTPIGEESLVKQRYIKHIISLGVNRIAETKAWIHFKNEKGLIYSCRRYVEDFPDLTGFMDVQGNKTRLPPGLKEALGIAEMFSSEHTEYNLVTISIKDGWLVVEGKNEFAWYREKEKLTSPCKPLTFQIAPKTLTEICKDHKEVILSEKRLKVEGTNFCFVSCLGIPKSKEDKNAEASEEDTD